MSLAPSVYSSVWATCSTVLIHPPALAVPVPSGLSVLCVQCHCLLHQLKKQEGFLLSLFTIPEHRLGPGLSPPRTNVLVAVGYLWLCEGVLPKEQYQLHLG